MPLSWQKAEYLWYFNTDFFYQFSILVSHVPWKVFGIDDPEVWIYLYRYKWSSRFSNSFILLYKFIGVQLKRKKHFSEVQLNIGSTLVTLALQDLPEKQKYCSRCWQVWWLLGFCLLFFSSILNLIYTVCFAYDWARYLVISMQWYVCP